MEKEAGILLKQEIKICLPFYKIVSSLLFIFILSLVRGISYVEEIGIAIEEPRAVLAMVFCADSYLVEVQSGRSDIFKLYSFKKQMAVIWKRILLQVFYLMIITMAGYGLFYWQNPERWAEEISEAGMFGIFIPAVAVTILFFSLFSVTVSNLFRNLWAGIGLSFVFWLFFVSKSINELLGTWSLFAYSFRSLEEPYNFNWLYGKLMTVIFAFILAALMPVILKKRG